MVATKSVVGEGAGGRAIPSHAFHIFVVRSSFVAKTFPQVTSYWQRINVPRGCAVDHPMVFTYRSRELREPKSSC